MDPRSKKSRSIGNESRTSSTNPADRPQLGDRQRSAPSVAARRRSVTKLGPDGVKIQAVIDRDSKASIRDDPFFRRFHTPETTRLAEQSRDRGSAGDAQDVVSSCTLLCNLNTLYTFLL